MLSKFSKFSKFSKIWRRLGWFLVLARRLGCGDLVRSARRARARKSVVGGILEWVKNCDGFSAELGVRVAGGLKSNFKICVWLRIWRVG